jgi:hypothetical protein
MNYLKALGAALALAAALLFGPDLAFATPPARDKALVYNRTSSLSANTDALATDVTSTGRASLIRVWVSPGTASVFNYTVDDGTTVLTLGLNASAALNASDQYVFDIPAVGGYTYNFQFETTQSSGFPILKVQEVDQ